VVPCRRVPSTDRQPPAADQASCFRSHPKP
jgi:hypothetical protein